MILVAPSATHAGIAGYTIRELRRILREHRGIDLPADVPGPDRFPERPSDEDAIVLGVRGSGAAVHQLLDTGFLAAPTQPQGYSMRCGPHLTDSRRQLLAIVGTDAAGTLHALRDLEHYHLQTRPDRAGALGITPFQRCEHPRIEYRGQGQGVEMCGRSEANLRFFQRKILQPNGTLTATRRRRWTTFSPSSA